MNSAGSLIHIKFQYELHIPGIWVHNPSINGRPNPTHREHAQLKRLFIP
jgi:hypothetical protein